jgi:hypothetical protein
MRTAGPGAVCEDVKGWSPFTLPSILYDHSWDNTSPVRHKRIRPAKSFVHSQIIFGTGKLGYGTIPQLTRNGLGKRPVWRPFYHCESNPSLFRVLVGGDKGTPYVSPRITAIRYAFPLCLPPIFPKYRSRPATRFDN